MLRGKSKAPASSPEPFLGEAISRRLGNGRMLAAVIRKLSDSPGGAFETEVYLPTTDRPRSVLAIPQALKREPRGELGVGVRQELGGARPAPGVGRVDEDVPRFRIGTCLREPEKGLERVTGGVHLIARASIQESRTEDRHILERSILLDDEPRRAP